MLVFLASLVGCNVFPQNGVKSSPTSASNRPGEVNAVGVDMLSDNPGNLFINGCNLRFEIPTDWAIKQDPSTPGANNEIACSEFVMTNYDGMLTISVKPAPELVAAFQTCPNGTVIVKNLSSTNYVVRIPTEHGFSYANASLIAGTNDENEHSASYMCQRPAAILIGKNFFIVDMQKKNQLFNQKIDLSTTDDIIASFKFSSQ